ncbi:MAG: hypothetical protein KKC76_02950 [Proteobacteria bacterium]|nr:hypothetical protein [Pseudomonadota bacterium]MCG2746878.1 hypothetical protein [Desulfobulbaceae bacterium]
MDTDIEFSINAAVGEFFVRGWFLDVAFGGTIHFFCICMGDDIKIQMAVPAQNLTMNRIGVYVLTDVKQARFACLGINPGQTRVLVAYATCFFIRRVNEGWSIQC